MVILKYNWGKVLLGKSDEKFSPTKIFHDNVFPNKAFCEHLILHF